jgi:hypothetical protein
LGNVSQPEANWQKELENQVSNLSGKLSALCSEMKELRQLLFVDDEDGKSNVMQMSKGDAHVRKKRRATIVPQMRSPTTSRNTRARRELTPLRKSKRVQKQLS